MPIWLLLQPVPNWRWGLAVSSTAWYPSLRLFRQCSSGNRPELIRAMKQAQGSFLRSRLDRGLPARVRAPKAAWETSRSSDRCVQLA